MRGTNMRLLIRSMLDFRLSFVFRRMLGKPTCVKHSGARLGRSARILNSGQRWSGCGLSSGRRGGGDGWGGRM